ncbi:MAG: hypothetical protein ACYTG1_10570 [Planctomycetota bacterium]|jgi:hypothetical protein
MLHDGILTRTTAPGPLPPAVERRESLRVPFPGEVVIRWHHDLETPVRYQVANAGDGGFRIRSSAPLVEGLTGTATKLLPGGRDLDRSVMIVWFARAIDGDGYDAGVRFF